MSLRYRKSKRTVERSDYEEPTYNDQIRRASLAGTFMTGSSPAAAQPIALPEQPLLGSTLTADLLHDLPTDNNPFACWKPSNRRRSAIASRPAA